MIIDNEIIISDDLSLKSLNKHNISSKYSDWLNDKDLNKYTEIRFDNFNQDNALKYVQSCNESKNTLLMGIFLNDEHIGNIKADINFHHLFAGIGIIIGENRNCGKSIGTRSIKALSDYLFEYIKIFKINAGIYKNNIPSIKAFKRAGFDIEYTKKKHVINHLGEREDVYMMVRYAPKP